MPDSTSARLQDRAAGALMGAFIGDALALGPHWYYDLDELRATYGDWIDGYTDPQPGRYHAGLKAGQPSQAGVLLDGSGLHPSRKGWRIQYSSDGKKRVVDGPFAEAKELVGGYWFIVAASLDEATALAAENPCIACGLTLEIRPLELERASAYAVTNENR